MMKNHYEVTYNFEEMSDGAKKETLRDFIGSLADRSTSKIYSDLMSALGHTLSVEEYAEIATYMYLNNETFRKFANTGKYEKPVLVNEPVKEVAKEVVEEKKMANPIFKAIMDASFGADYMPNFGADGVIYKVSEYTRAKAFGLPTFGIPVVNIDTNKVIGNIPEFI